MKHKFNNAPSRHIHVNYIFTRAMLISNSYEYVVQFFHKDAIGQMNVLSSGVFSLDIEDTTRTIANLGLPEHHLAKTADTMLRETSKATGTSASLPIEGVVAAPLPLSRLAQCGTPRKLPSEVGALNYLSLD